MSNEKLVTDSFMKSIGFEPIKLRAVLAPAFPEDEGHWEIGDRSEQDEAEKEAREEINELEV